MALLNCPECGAQISDRAAACPHCGCPTVPAATPPPEGPATRQMGEWTYYMKVACPHCAKVGQVATRPLRLKAGISGGKATGALLTGGLSLLATGLSRKESVSEAYCYNCKTRWTIR